MFDGFAYIQNIPQQVIDHMVFAPENIPAIIAFAIFNIGGFFVWFPNFALCFKEHKSPYPIWMHCWYLTGDLMGTIFFWYLAVQYDFFYAFVFYGIGLPIWMCLEIFNIYQGVKNERGEQFQRFYKDEVTLAQAWKRVAAMFVFFLSLNLYIYVLLGGIDNAPLLIVYPFTNFLLSVGPLWLWNERATKGTREGNSVWLQIFISFEIFVTILPPGFGWPATISPLFDNPFYYILGTIAFLFSLNNLRNILKLPPKEGITPRSLQW